MSVAVRRIVQKHSRAKLTTRQLLYLIADKAQADGIAWYGEETMAEELGCRERTVRDCIKKAVELGELEVRKAHKAHRGRVRFNVYRVTFPGIAEPDLDRLEHEGVQLEEPFTTGSFCRSSDADDRQKTAATTGKKPQRRPAKNRANGGRDCLTGIESRTEIKNGADAAASAVVDLVRPTKPTQATVQGKNLPLEALCDVCGIDPDSPQRRKAEAALADQTNPKIPGIRSLCWLECERKVDADPTLLPQLQKLTDEPERFEQMLAERIQIKAAAIRAADPWRTSITPHVIRDHWLDIEHQPAAGRPNGDVIRDAFREADARRSARISDADIDAAFGDL